MEHSDFGKILDAWENRREQAASDKNAKNAPKKKRITPVETQRSIASAHGALEQWLQNNSVPDKDFIARETAEKNRRISRRIAQAMEIDDVVDLHGLTQDEAWSALENFVDRCYRSGDKKILIIHGKGNHSAQGEGEGVLKKMVGTFVARSSRIGLSGHPENKDGGSGATWAIIRR
ncbi:MAG: Smr/MutS family protein [Treponemataceae bacterium]|nr:MAG: Smr/MutS family protein [Treponemataceae bacterium]